MQAGSKGKVVTYRQVNFGKRSRPDATRQARELLMNPDLLNASPPEDVRQYFEQKLPVDFVKVAQWCVDNKEPRVLRALYDDGLRGPIRLEDVTSHTILQALIELNDLPLSRLEVALEFKNRVDEDSVDLLIRLLCIHNLKVLSLRLDLSSTLSPQAATKLLMEVNALAELQRLQVLLDGGARGPLPEAWVHAMLGCRKALMMSADSVMPLLISNLQQLTNSHPRFALEFKGFLKLPQLLVDTESRQSQRTKHFPLFKQAVLCGEFSLSQALIALELAPEPLDVIDFGGTPLPTEALACLNRWHLSIRFIARLDKSQLAHQLGHWVRTAGPCLHSLVLTLSTAFEESDLRCLTDGLHSLGKTFRMLAVTCDEGFAVSQHIDVPPSAPSSSGLAVLQLRLAAVGEQPPDGRGMAASRLIQLAQPARLEVLASDTSKVLALLEAFPDAGRFPYLASMNIVCREADTSGPLTVKALEKFFARFHGPAQFRFDGGRFQWKDLNRTQVVDMVLRNDCLTELTLNSLNMQQELREVFRYHVSVEMHLRNRIFTRGKLQPDMAAKAFFSAHLDRRLEGDLADRVMGLGNLSERDRLALALVSPATRAAGDLGRQGAALARALFDGSLDDFALRTLLTDITTGERNLPLARALQECVDQQVRQAAEERPDSLRLKAWLAVQHRVQQEASTHQRQSTD